MEAETYNILLDPKYVDSETLKKLAKKRNLKIKNPVKSLKSKTSRVHFTMNELAKLQATSEANRQNISEIIPPTKAKPNPPAKVKSNPPAKQKPILKKPSTKSKQNPKLATKTETHQTAKNRRNLAKPNTPQLTTIINHLKIIYRYQ